MTNPIYCSTGTFVGMPNGCDHRLITQFGGQIRCDGFELLIYRAWYERLDEVLSDLRGVHIPVIHADKQIGDLISGRSAQDLARALALFSENCRAARALSAKLLVLHLWGVPLSDADPDWNIGALGELRAVAREAGVLLTVENTACVCGDPLAHFQVILNRYPDCQFTLDTRFLAFAGELDTVREMAWLWPHVPHLHVSDYVGGYKTFDRLRPIPQPGEGNIDFDTLFSYLRAIGFAGSVTLESPAMQAAGVDAQRLNRGLSFIRQRLIHT